MASLSTKTGRSSFAVMHWKTPSWQKTTFHFCDLRPTAAESGSGLFMPCSRRKKVELWNIQKQNYKITLQEWIRISFKPRNLIFRRYLFCQNNAMKIRMNADVLRVFDLSVTHFIFWAPAFQLIGRAADFSKGKKMNRNGNPRSCSLNYWNSKNKSLLPLIGQ